MASEPPYPVPINIGTLLRVPFDELVRRLHTRLAEAGYPDIRPSHGLVFQHIDDTGSRLVELAGRAQMTPQAMSELVDYLERHGYVERAADPADRRAKLIRITAKGWDVVAVARGVIEEIEGSWREALGARRYRSLLGLLEELNTVAGREGNP